MNSSNHFESRDILRTTFGPSKLLIPLAFASLLGGMLTLIGTPPNIVVSNQLVSEGLAPFGFFDFTPVGLLMLVIGILFMILVGRHLLPDRPRRLPLSTSASQAETLSKVGLPLQGLVMLAMAFFLPLLFPFCSFVIRRLIQFQ